MAANVPLIQVDAFTNEPFGGNPAAVCLLEDEPAAGWMQAVAAEMNLSETAFVRQRTDREFSLRWFTPTVEVPLCGHATLASAHVLWEEKRVEPGQPITFHTKSGRLIARREADWIYLDFPALPVEPVDPPSGLAAALGCQPRSAHRNRFTAYLVELDSEQAVRELTPDFAALRQLECEACIVTARGSAASCDFVSRFFAPRLGIDEDPVTGVAHCSLGPYWAERLGKTELIGHQVSKRGGIVRVRAHNERVELGGQAVTVLRAELVHPCRPSEPRA